jgi:putative acyl-CoA dehydrogenase
MVAVLSELCAESEAHTLTAMRLSSAFDKMEHNKDEAEANFFRIAVAVSKYFVTKRAPQFIYECMEAHGGNGFVEDYPLAMLYRHAPLNSIWEGSGNVMVLDILRAGKGLPLLLKEIALSQGMDKHMDEFTKQLNASVSELLKGDLMSMDHQRSARNLADRLAMGFQASLLLRYGSPTAAKLYIGSRIANEGPRGANYGSSTTAVTHKEARALIQENMPVFY